MVEVWDYRLSQSDIDNGNIRFASCPFTFSKEHVGGSNKFARAEKTLTVTFKPGSVSQQWLYGNKKIFANRNPHTKDFFAAIGARAGTVIRISRASRDAVLIEKASP